ncbi:hypothetical protein HG442_001205 [Candidatus Gracilibacteria bacterium]|nr:hypothetical protein [Candidatus Gracilibacteria bacterium]
MKNFPEDSNHEQSDDYSGEQRLHSRKEPNCNHQRHPKGLDWQHDESDEQNHWQTQDDECPF